jgi:DEAD/DEAH box helicase domain-containing protein
MSTVEKLLSAWRSDPSIYDNITEWQTIPSIPAKMEPFPPDMKPWLREALIAAGIQSLYSHQAVAWRQAQAGKHVVVVTGTASGKSLCYNIPVLERLSSNSKSRSLYLFPTKALAQDQANKLKSLLQRNLPDTKMTEDSLLENFPLKIAVYDGDTPSNNRPAIREQARLLISNPDMLHTGVLPHHTLWANYFRDLEFVVIDEIHYYRGILGSHFANVIRRLKRISRFYGSNPQFILTSATIANPLELAERLIEPQNPDQITLIAEDGSAHGRKHFLIYNPPIVEKELGLRKSSTQEAIRIVQDLLTYQLQTIIFARTRRTVELILTYLRDQLNLQTPADPVHKIIRGYRSGYLPGQRREIERGLRDGVIQVVIATNALELGIDIGGMDASILVGFPGTIAATWQQAGRSGRGTGSSLAVLITTPDPLDQFLASHPEYFFSRSPEHALINPDNLLILLGHVRCAAFELPFQQGDCFGSLDSLKVSEYLNFLTEQGDLHQSKNRFFWMADQYPAQSISLRSASADTVVLQVNSDLGATTIGEVDRTSACWMVHPNAVYLHEGQSYLVDDLDLDQNIAHLSQVDTDYYTEHRSETSVELIEKLDELSIRGGEKSVGEIRVTTQVVGFRKLRWITREQLGYSELLLPPYELQTTGFWITLSDSTVESLRDQGLWNNDPNQYGPNWKTQRDRCRQRDGYRCQVCGTFESEREHHVHHKVPYRTFASFEQANRLENLITLCSTCHRRVETVVRVRSGLAGLGFVFGHLAPLFLMCDFRDLGVHTDPQSALAQGKPAVTIYDQYPAGIGLSQRLFEIQEELIARALELVDNCSCSDGCPSCVGPGGENGSGSKIETLAILKSLSSSSQENVG